MLSRLLVTTALLAAASPAAATLTIAFSDGSGSFSCTDGASCDLSPVAGRIILGTTTLGTGTSAVTIFGTFSESSLNPDLLQIQNLSIQNGSAAETIKMAVGDTGFTGNPGEFTATTAGVFTGAGTTSNAAFGFWVDNADTQGATTTSNLPGTDIVNFSDTSTSSLPNGFSNNQTVGFNASAPFSITEGAVYTLTANANVGGNEQAIEGIPEPRTWAMLGIGFGLMAMLGLKRKRTARHALV